MVYPTDCSKSEFITPSDGKYDVLYCHEYALVNAIQIKSSKSELSAL